MTRQTKTPTQRAEEALALAERRYARAVTTRDRLKDELTAALADLEEARSLRAYATQHPALKTSPSTTNQEAGTPA